jgi:eukaryotic-like serine/threonine-protein kinase
MSTRSLVLLTLTSLTPWVGSCTRDTFGAAEPFTIPIPEGMEIWNAAFYAEVAISPDGRYVVFTNRGESPARLYRHDLTDGTTVPIPGVDRGGIPFFSPDSRWVAYVSGGRMWKVPVEGGEPTELAPIENFFGGAWGPDGTIVYAPEPGGGLYKVSADGGEPERLTESGWFPSFLPDGRSVLFDNFVPDRETISVVDIQTGEIESLSITGRLPLYVDSGYLLFGRDHDVMAVAFDPGTLEWEGEARALIRDVGNGIEAPRQFSVSADGTLVYITGGKALVSEPVRVGLDGSVTPLGMAEGYYLRPRLSPDGSTLAYTLREPSGGDIWLAGVDGSEPRQLTSDGTTELLDWTPDGEALLVYRGPIPGTLYALPIDGGQEAVGLFSGAANGLRWVYADEMTPDGSRVVGRIPSSGQGNSDLALLATDGSGAVEWLEGSTEAGVEHHTGTVSPDGRWFAFVSDRSGRREVYVRPMDGSGPAHQLSGEATGWALYPQWSPDSSGLYYIQAGQLWRVDVGSDQDQPMAAARSLFELDSDLFWGSGNYTISNFDLAPDGDWFLMVRGVGEWQPPTEISGLTDVGAAIEAVFAR